MKSNGLDKNYVYGIINSSGCGTFDEQFNFSKKEIGKP